MLLEGGVGALPKVLDAYMSEVTLLTDPACSLTAWPPQALAQRGGKVAKYASGCCSVAPAT